MKIWRPSAMEWRQIRVTYWNHWVLMSHHNSQSPLNLMETLKRLKIINCSFYEISQGGNIKLQHVKLTDFPWCFWKWEYYRQSDFTHTVISHMYLPTVSIQMKVVHCWSPRGGIADNQHFNVYVLWIIFIWFGHLRHHSTAALQTRGLGRCLIRPFW